MAFARCAATVGDARRGVAVRFARRVLTRHGAGARPRLRRVDVSDANHLSRSSCAAALPNAHQREPVYRARAQLPPHPARRRTARLARTALLHRLRARPLPFRLLVVRQDAPQFRRCDLSAMRHDGAARKSLTRVRRAFAPLLRGAALCLALCLNVSPPVSAQTAPAQARTSVAARPLWPGARFTEADRTLAIRRGLNFIYRTALDRANFAEYGSDYLWCFYTLATAVNDAVTKRTAHRMGVERARLWRTQHRALPTDADAAIIADFVFGSDAADSLGLRDERMKRTLRRVARRYPARSYLLFDPLTEPPPTDVPAACAFDGAEHSRGTLTCRVCHRPLQMRTRYDVWYDALITAYVGDRYGVMLGAHYADVLKWLPALRPYPARAQGAEFYDSVYAITHVVYTLNHYNQARLSPRLLPQEYAFLHAHLGDAVALKDTDMLGEMMDTLRAFSVNETDPALRAAIDFYLTQQNPDGSWGNLHADDIYDRYHPTWNAVAGLSHYAWRNSGLSHPELKSLLNQWLVNRVDRNSDR